MPLIPGRGFCDDVSVCFDGMERLVCIVFRIGWWIGAIFIPCKRFVKAIRHRTEQKKEKRKTSISRYRRSQCGPHPSSYPYQYIPSRREGIVFAYHKPHTKAQFLPQARPPPPLGPRPTSRRLALPCVGSSYSPCSRRRSLPTLAGGAVANH